MIPSFNLSLISQETWDVVLQIFLFMAIGQALIWVSRRNKKTDCGWCPLEDSCLRTRGYKPDCPALYAVAVIFKTISATIAFNWALEITQFWWVTTILTLIYYCTTYYPQLRYLWFEK